MGLLELPGTVDDTQISWQEHAEALMAISRTALESGFNTTDGTVFTTASFTPSANKLVLVYISARPAGRSETASLSGNGLTWVLVEGEQDTEGGMRYSALWRAMGASPSAGQLTITFTASMRNATWEISEFDNVDTSGTNGSGAIVQAVKNAASSVTSISPTLSSFGDATNNATYMGATHRIDEAQNVEAGFTELSEQQTGEAHTGSAMWKVGEDLSPTIDWATSANAVAVACEIKAVAVVGGAGIPVSLLHRNQMRHMLNR
ncbi:MAG TPA: hypothetical protein ENI05_05120 [Porticoccus sp.]|nr:hypothetical protein [Porticoccus sp.]